MIKVQQLVMILFISLILFPFTVKGNTEWTEKKVVIAGKVLNYARHQDHKTIRVIFNDLFSREKSYTATIKEDGTFNIGVLLLYEQDFQLDYGRLTTLFCSPGDSLYLEIDGDIWNNKSPDRKSNVQVKGGTATKTNQDIIKFLDELPNEKYIYNNYRNAFKSKTPEAFTEYILERDKEYHAYLKAFTKENKTNKIFQNWAEDRLKYQSWHDLLRYTWVHPHYNNIKKESFKIPSSYFSFLDKYDMNDTQILSRAHVNFLHELYMYAPRRKRISGGKGNQEISVNKSDQVKEIVQNIKQNSSGFTQQFLYAHFLLDLLQAQFLPGFEEAYDASLITNTYFKNIIQIELANLKVYLANQDTKGANLVDIESNITSGLIKSLLAKYKGKVIYIDFWGPWCGPCLEEMPYSKELQQYFHDKDVVFLFLAYRTTDAAWKATIANMQLTGEHLKLTDDQFNVFAAEFNISGAPHYTLVNKKGNVVLKAAPRPSDKENLKNAIEMMLK